MVIHDNAGRRDPHIEIMLAVEIQDVRWPLPNVRDKAIESGTHSAIGLTCTNNSARGENGR